ncbi:MAG: hypothetical protein HRT38_18075 [Alteromonadaceae bacterium]|nr:hypothetical protein [Alteromonadaceae bacterium]
MFFLAPFLEKAIGYFVLSLLNENFGQDYGSLILAFICYGFIFLMSLLVFIAKLTKFATKIAL